MPLKAFALNCILKNSDDSEKSSTDRLLADLLAAMGAVRRERRNRSRARS
ncbi:hypothetical protein [Mesorhizobium sp. B2-4-19]|nr:hypothetical protein [Mesorhizobium sp. B2-4-19]